MKLIVLANNIVKTAMTRQYHTYMKFPLYIALHGYWDQIQLIFYNDCCKYNCRVITTPTQTYVLTEDDWEHLTFEIDKLLGRYEYQGPTTKINLNKSFAIKII